MVFLKKFLGIIIASTVLLSAGSIYANVDAAANLSKWYENSFQKESAKLGATTAIGILKTFEHVNDFLDESKREIASSLQSFTGTRVNEVESEIEQYQNDIESQIDTTVTELEKENFDDYAEKAKVEEEIEQDIENILEEVLSEQ